MVRKTLGSNRPPYEKRELPREPTKQKVIVDLFGGKSLNIFEKASNVPDILETWNKLEQRELKLAVTHPPKNYFGKFNVFLYY